MTIRRVKRPVPVSRDNLDRDLGGPKFWPTPPSEKDVQRVIVVRAADCGFTVRSTSQYRASHVSEGFADLYLVHRRLGLAVWWETKTYQSRPWKKGVLELKPRSAVQVAFAEDMAACRHPCGWGALPEFFDFLVGVGLAQRIATGILLKPMR